MVNSNHSRIIYRLRDIFAYRASSQSPFSPLYSVYIPPSGGMPNNYINVGAYVHTFSGLQFCRWQYGTGLSSFI